MRKKTGYSGRDGLGALAPRQPTGHRRIGADLSGGSSGICSVIQRQLEVVVRSMDLDDLALVLDIDRLSFPVPWPERSYRYELTENPASHLLVAESNGPLQSVVGFIGCWPIAGEVHIRTLGVHPPLPGPV